MGQIKLSKYITEIDQEMKAGQYTQVIAHCRQILKQYPRYIGAYRLMGIALMEQQAYTEAENIFQRVLSLDISDFTSHKGLAEIMAETSRIEQAIWHIEHAFEIDPNHADVVHLREQYYRRAGISAPVVSGMPLASVARLYVKSGIYDQAIEELKRMLDHNQDRLDWKAILAVAYWRDGRNSEALQLGETVLEILPNNYQARMILGDIWWQNDRKDIAGSHLDILQQTLLVSQDHNDAYPLAQQVLAQTERIAPAYTVNRLGATEIDEWSSVNWETPKAVQEEPTEELPVEDVFADAESDSLLDQMNESDFNLPLDEVSSGDVESDENLESALDNLFESLDDDPSIADSDLLDADAKWEENHLGTGLLDSFAADIGELNESDSIDLDESDESFSWLGEDDNELFQTADDPDPMSDSELNDLPDIASLFDTDFEDLADDASQIIDSGAEGVQDDESALSEPGTDFDLNIDAAADESSDFLDSAEDLFAEDLLNEDFLATSATDLPETGALLPLPDDDDVEEAFEWPAPDDDASETDMMALFEQPDESNSLEGLDTDATPNQSDIDDQTGFTGWLEDEADSETELGPGTEDNGQFEPFDSGILDELVADEPPVMENDIDVFDSSSNALSGGLFEFLSDKENQLNPLPEPTSELDSSEVFDDLGDLDEEDFLGEPHSDFELEVEPADDAEESNFSDLFDTSWLDAEPTEEIDLLADSNEEMDLNAFAESLGGDFDFLEQDTDSDDKFQPQDDFDSLFGPPDESGDATLDVADDPALSLDASPEPFEDQDQVNDELASLSDFNEALESDGSEFDWISDLQSNEPMVDGANEVVADSIESSKLFDEEVQTNEELPSLTGFDESSETNNSEFDWISDESADELSFLDEVANLNLDEESIETPDVPDQNIGEEESEFLSLDAMGPEADIDFQAEAEESEEDLSFLESMPDASIQPSSASEEVDENDLFGDDDLSFLDGLSASSDSSDIESSDAQDSTDNIFEDLEESSELFNFDATDLEPNTDIQAEAKESEEDLSFLESLSDASILPSSVSEEVDENDLFGDELSFLDELSTSSDSSEIESSDVQDSADNIFDDLEDSSELFNFGATDLEPNLDLQAEASESEEDLSFLESLPDPSIEPINVSAETDENDLFGDELSFLDELSASSESNEVENSDLLGDDRASETFEALTALGETEENADNNPDVSSIDWLIPEPEPDSDLDEDLASEQSNDDLGWLSLLEEATSSADVESETKESEDEIIWTSDLSAAANPILSPSFDELDGDSTEGPTADSSPDWLIEFPEYNNVGLQTGRLEEEPFHDTGRFTKRILPEIGQPHETESRVDETPEEPEEEQEFDPIIFRESTAIKLPDWLSDTTESASLGFEPDPIVDTDIDHFEEFSSEDELLKPSSNASTDDSDFVSDDALLFPEDDADMERDKDGNPIPPESQDLEDTLNWLEELAIIDVHGEDHLISEVGQTLDTGADESPVQADETIDEEPLSDIFSGGSSLHAFADIDDVGEELEDREEIPGDASEETLTWLDDLFTPTEEPASEFPTATWDASDVLAEIEESDLSSADSVTDLGLEEVVDAEASTVSEQVENTSESIESIIDEIVEAPVEAVAEEKPAKKARSMFGGDDDLHISEEEISQAAEFGDAVPGMEDMPDDPDALMAWLNLGSDDTVEAEAPVETVVDEIIEPVEAQPTTEAIEPEAPVEAVAEEKPAKKAPSMFGGDDDLHISEEEISQAAEFGDAVPGMEDMPDDPDALMAWLNLGPDELEDDSGFSDSDEVDADLIVADLSVDGAETDTEVESAVSGTDQLDELFDELASDIEDEISEEDLIFGDLGTGRLSGTDWLDKMTFDSDPALLGEVPTIPPHMAQGGEVSDEDIEGILDEIDSEMDSQSGASVDSLEELPDDPDEFLKILESNVSDAVPDLDQTGIEAIAFEDADPDVPEWLQVEPDSSGETLEWLDDASPSGVFNWLEAEEDAESQSSTPAGADAGVQGAGNETRQLPPPPSMFDADPADAVQPEGSSVAEIQTLLKAGENIPEVIRKIRSQLEVSNDSALQKLLGDAYMETGQLQDALDAYRQAQRLL